MKKRYFKKDSEIQEMEKKGFEYIGTVNDFKIPKWWECGWRRVGCGKGECRLCGMLKQNELRHIMKGEDPGSMESVFADVGRGFEDALQMIKQDAAEKGIDITNIDELASREPPEPDEFPLYRKVREWRELIFGIFDMGIAAESAWIYTEAAADLKWYSDMIVAKTYRQLCSRWELDRGEEDAGIDYKYTKYVLRECVDILKKSLSEISSADFPQAQMLSDSLIKLRILEESIMEI